MGKKSVKKKVKSERTGSTIAGMRMRGKRQLTKTKEHSKLQSTFSFSFYATC